MTERQAFDWLNADSRLFLERGYLQPDQTPEQRIWDIAKTAENYLDKPGFADKFYDYMSRGWYSLASPEWSNYGTNRGLAISCFQSYCGDSITKILDTISEVGAMTKMGGGTSVYMGDVRPRGSKIGHNQGESFGSVHFMELFDKTISTISQGSVRRGSIAPYLPIEHEDFYEFIGIGSGGHNIQDCTHGVTVTDAFIQRVLDRDEEAMKRWAMVIKNRIDVGFPYIIFIDTANKNTVDVYKDKQMPILASNLCTEIFLPTSELESFVCVLMSMNAKYYHEWKDTDAVEVATMFLDTVVTDFLTRLDSIKESDPATFRHMERAYRFAKNHRALGLGVLGLHDFLLEEHLPFDSVQAFKYNNEIFKTINTQAWDASRKLADEYGEPELLKGYGRRNTTLTAVAPTKSSSFILGQTSQSIEPHLSNIYPRDAAKGRINWKSPYLEKCLEGYGRNDRETWDSIKRADGSVQHLDFMDDYDKLVFRTFGEIPPKSIVELAAIRQQWIDQSQSLNLRINPDVPVKEINELYLHAHSLGVKSLYYQKGTSSVQSLTRSGCGSACEA